MSVPRRREIVAHVITESAPFGGAQRNTLLTLAGLAAAGYPTRLVCGPGGPLIDRARALGVEVDVVPHLVRAVDPARDLRALVALWRCFRGGRDAIVHTHSFKAGVLGRVAARLAGVPLIVHTFHGVPFEIRRDLRSGVFLALERWVGRWTDRLVCVGRLVADEVTAWRLVPPARVVTIHSGIDFQACVPGRHQGEVRRALGIEDAWPVVVSVGRLSPQKAPEDLLEAIARLVRRYPLMCLLLLGDGELRPRLATQIHQRGLEGHVRLLGERSDVADILHASDLYAMASRWEGVGRALTEAMVCGLPVVATAVNGVPELVRHGETGLLVPPRDPAALAAAIARLADNAALARRLGASARRTARELMDGRRMVAAIIDLYEGLRGRHAVAAGTAA